MNREIFRCLRAGLIGSALYWILVLALYFVGPQYSYLLPMGLYDLIQVLQTYEAVLLPLFWVLLILFIIFFNWKKTVNFIEEIAVASSLLVSQDDEPIQLPARLREIEDSMNQIKRTARKNERDAREAEQRKNDLVMNLAHDIRTPLASVIGYLNLLDEAPDMPKEQRAKYTGITLEKAYRLEQLIEEFFEITRFNISTIVLQKTTINLTFMLQQMADEFYPLLAPKNKSAIVEAPEGLLLWGDADKLSRVFHNIFKNAIAYSYDGSVIVIQAYGINRNIIVQFSNRGDPIPPQRLETIFERFFRLDTARSSQTGGSGLGLAIAKEIVDVHEGKISAQSDGTKTTFTVVLPQGDIRHREKTARTQGAAD